MKDKAHILFISSWFPSPSSSEGTFVEMHLLALQSRDCKCAIMLNGEITFGTYLKLGFDKSKALNFRRRSDIQFIDNLTVHKRPLRYSKNPLEERKGNILKGSVKTLKEYIRKEGKPDFLFHHGIFDYTYISTHLSKIFDIPIWYMENSPNIEEDKFPCANSFVSDAEKIDFVKNAERRFAVTQDYVDKMSKIFKVPFELVPNVITDDFFKEKPTRQKLDNFTFCNVAILDERKRQDLILEAFAMAFRGNSKFRLVIAGDGKLKQTLSDLASDLGIADQVDIPGYLDRKEVVSLLDQSDAFVLASKAETFGVVVIEAMARGIPAISSDIAGTREIVNASNGLLFKEGSKEDLSKAMLQLVDQYETYQPGVIVADVQSRFGPDAVKNGLFG